MAFPIEYTKRAPRHRRRSPEIEEIVYDGGRRYEGYEERLSPIEDDELDYQTKRFHEKVTDHYRSAYPSRRLAQFAPGASAGQVHRDRELYLASTERVNAAVGFGISGRNAAYNQAVQDAGYARHNYNNRCAEGGTTGMIQRKYGDGVDMRGDRISTYGRIADYQGQSQFDGFHPGCASRPGERNSMGCEDVLAANGIIDIHRRRRSSRGI